MCRTRPRCGRWTPTFSTTLVCAHTTTHRTRTHTHHTCAIARQARSGWCGGFIWGLCVLIDGRGVSVSVWCGGVCVLLLLARLPLCLPLHPLSARPHAPIYVTRLTGLDTSMDLHGMFGDVKFVCMGGSAQRMERVRAVVATSPSLPSLPPASLQRVIFFCCAFVLCSL